MTRLLLPQVTVVAADTRTPGLAAQALLQSMAQVQFARAVLFTDGWVPDRALPGIDIVRIPTFRSAADYSHFVMREMPSHIDTSHVLVTQWDGFVCDASAWRNDFLQYDYIGAVWHDQPAACNVGNGGFSLRSQRFLAAGCDPCITDTHPEDAVLCRTHRGLLEQAHGVRFAPASVAQHFAFENIAPRGPVFGFHGPYNLPRLLDETTLAALVDAMPDDFFLVRDARRLARALLAHRMPRTAARVVQRRRAAGRREPGLRLLGAAAQVAGWLTPEKRPRQGDGR